MAEGSKDQQQQGTKASTKSIGLRLAPVDNSDQPKVANYTSLNPSPGFVYLDFGFLEPAVLAALPKIAKQGGKLPDSLNGKLAVRVAVGYDTAANLYQQLGQMLARVGAAMTAEKRRDGTK